MLAATASNRQEHAPGDVVADAKYKEMSMKTVTMKTKAWISTDSDISPKDLMEGKRLDRLTFWHGDFNKMGYTFAGEAELTITVPDEKTLIGNKVEALREEAKTIRAEATARVTRIEGQINDLLALTFDPSE